MNDKLIEIVAWAICLSYWDLYKGHRTDDWARTAAAGHFANEPEEWIAGAKAAIEALAPEFGRIRRETENQFCMEMAKIRQLIGVGDKPMLSEMAAEVEKYIDRARKEAEAEKAELVGALEQTLEGLADDGDEALSWLSYIATDVRGVIAKHKGATNDPE